MWLIDNRTPFAAERGWVRDRDGAEIWLVAVKATFDVRDDGFTQLAKEQPPVLRLPEHHGEPGRSSIKYEADLVLAKKTTDIVVVGHAHAPPGRTVTHMDVGFKVGPVQKVLRVSGDRRWNANGMTAAEAFRTMPLVYERAFGGVDRASATPDTDWEWRNPVGTGFAISSRNTHGLALPNIEDPKQAIRAWSDRPAPAGFGAIASHWQPRARLAGTYDERWQKTRAPLLAEDLDDRHFQCAPVDQQAPHWLRGGEPVVLLGLTPGQDLRFTLPRLHLGFETHFYDGERRTHSTKHLHTVILEPDFPRLSLVWHTALSCHFKVHKLERTVVRLKADLSTDRPPSDDDGELDSAETSP